VSLRRSTARVRAVKAVCGRRSRKRERRTVDGARASAIERIRELERRLSDTWRTIGRSVTRSTGTRKTREARGRRESCEVRRHRARTKFGGFAERCRARTSLLPHDNGPDTPGQHFDASHEGSFVRRIEGLDARPSRSPHHETATSVTRLCDKDATIETVRVPSTAQPPLAAHANQRANTTTMMRPKSVLFRARDALLDPTRAP
jgi:hypothetical protein